MLQKGLDELKNPCREKTEHARSSSCVNHHVQCFILGSSSNRFIKTSPMPQESASVDFKCSLAKHDVKKDLVREKSTRPLPERAAHARWKMLGHVLRSPENSPAQFALSFVVENMNSLQDGERKIGLICFNL